MFNIIKNAIKNSNGVNRKLIASIAVLGLMIGLSPVLAQPPDIIPADVINHAGTTVASVFVPLFAEGLSPALCYLVLQSTPTVQCWKAMP